MIKTTEAGRSIEFTMKIAAKPEDVWRAIIEPEEIKRWFPLDARGEAKEGGLIEVSWGNDEWWGVTLTMPEPGRHIRFVDTQSTPDGEVTLYMDYHLETQDGETVVRFVHSGFGMEDSWDEFLEGLDAGWGYFFRNLKHYLEVHFGKSRILARAKPALAGSRSVLWGAMVGALGLDPAAMLGSAPGSECALKVQGTTAPAVVEALVPDRTFGVRLPDHDNSLLFLEIEGAGEKGRVGIWLSMYEPSPELEAQMQKLVEDAATALAATPQ